MATVQKTTLKRYNGTDWDPVYLANSADISYLGLAITVDKGSASDFADAESIVATTATRDLLTRIINNMTKMTVDTIPGIANGSGITSIDASKITGTINRANLPTDVGGKGVEVDDEDAKGELTSANVNVGDIVKVTGGKVYLVTATTPAVTYMELSDSASEIAWSRITGTPNTLAGYGITDAVNASEKVTVASSANAGKILVLDSNGKLAADITGDAATLGGQAASYYASGQSVTDVGNRVTTAEGEIDQLQTDVKNINAAWITSGTIDIARLPATVIERMHVITEEAELETLTTTQVQNGDTVKVTATGKMYYVIDDTKLGTGDYMQAFTEYTAGTASAVEWSGILNKPNTVAGYGITDAVATGDLVDSARTVTANAGKVLKIGADGKLNADITGDAATLGGKSASDFGSATDVTALKSTVGNGESGLVKDVNDLKTTVGSADSGLVKDVNDIKTQIGQTGTSGILKDIADLKAGTAIQALAASKLTGTVARANLPADISGRLFKLADLDTAKTTLTPQTAATGDLVKLNNGQVYVIVDGTQLSADEGYELIVDTQANVDWAHITGTPTTLSGYGITDAVAASEKTTTAGAGSAGKILVLNASGKLDVDVTGDAATLGGQAPTHYATAQSVTDLGGRVTAAEGDIDQLQTDIKAIDAAWIASGTIDIARLPHGALERCVVVANDTARFALTTGDVQTGDTVKVTETGKMYFVVDDTQLSVEDGYEIYTAGTASAVEWSGVLNKPNTLAGYGITDAVNASEKTTTAGAGSAGKILVLNAEGKLDADITGHVDWANINGKPTSSATQIDEAVTNAAHTNRTVLDALADASGRLTYNGAGLATKSELDEVALGSLKVVDELPGSASEGQLVLEKIK